MALLPFAQLEFPGLIGLGEGRYIVRAPDSMAPIAGTPAGAAAGGEPDVLALRELGAERRSARRRRRRATEVSAEPAAAPLPLTRVTLIRASVPLSDQTAAESWLARVGDDAEIAGALAEETCRVLNRAIDAHRASAPDLYAADRSARDASSIRFGFGTGEEVASGRWSSAVELSADRRKGLKQAVMDSVGAQQRVAAVLGGRDRVTPAEALLVAAERAALEHRHVEAAVTAAAAAAALQSSGGEAAAGEAATACSALRRTALSGQTVDPESLRRALRTLRRAVRATVGST